MVEIINALNSMALQGLAEYQIKKPHWTALATGDGMCLCLHKSTPEVQVKLAFHIRRSVNEWNLKQSREMRKFALRIALHVYDDFLIKDINGRQNVIGHGINTAARTVNLGEPGEIVATGDLYASVKRDEMFMDTFSPSKRKLVKDEWYGYRRIELVPERRDWEPDSPELLEPTADPMQPAPPTSSEINLLVSDVIDENQIDNNKLRLTAIQDWFWHPAAEHNTGPTAGFGSYKEEIPLKGLFRSFSALIAPNSTNFGITLKLMNDAGVLRGHKVLGEYSFILGNDSALKGMILGKLDAGVLSQMPLAMSYAPRFELALKVYPLLGNTGCVARLYINKVLVHTSKIPKEFTKRFGIQATGNGKHCHMTLSEGFVQTALK